MNWSFQLYSARDFQPWENVLELVARLGYARVEGFAGAYGDPPALRAALDRNGLSMPSGHFGLDVLEDRFEEAAATASVLGIETLICPFLAPEQRPDDAAGWHALGERLARVGERCRIAGLGFAWHNHDFELAPLADGTIPLRIVFDAAPHISWEIDVAWVARGGADPLAWIGEYAQRIRAVHVKDIAPAGEAADEDGWADVGHGTLDWPAIMKALRETTPANVFAMEHDKPSDLERFARRSIAAAQNF